MAMQHDHQRQWLFGRALWQKELVVDSLTGFIAEAGGRQLSL
jgi:hypothetical protein